MAGFDNPYSRTVAIAKIVLPLIGLGILSTLFLLSRPANQGGPTESSDINVLDLAREQRLGAPTYTGVTESGTTISISADVLRPDPASLQIVHGSEMRASVLTAGGFGYDITAKSGRIEGRARLTTLDEGVVIKTSNGYTITTDVARMRTDMSMLETAGPIDAKGPMGHLTAGQMRMTGDAGSGTGALLVFKGGVRLLYQPGN